MGLGREQRQRPPSSSTPLSYVVSCMQLPAPDGSLSKAMWTCVAFGSPSPKEIRRPHSKDDPLRLGFCVHAGYTESEHAVLLGGQEISSFMTNLWFQDLVHDWEAEWVVFP